MDNIVYILLAILIIGGSKDQAFILQNVEFDYFEEPALAEIFRAASKLFEQGKEINLVSLRQALITDSNSIALAKRLSIFRDFFVRTGKISSGADDEAVRGQVTVLLANISTNLGYSTPADVATYLFRGSYVGRKRRPFYPSTK